MKLAIPIGATLFALSLSIPCAWADETSKAAQIEELMRITKVEAMSGQMTGQIRAMMMNQLASAPAESRAEATQMMEKIIARIEDRMSWTKLKPEYVKLYGDVFTEEEITGMVSFYKTPLGQAVLQKMPLVVSKSMEIGQRQMAEIMPELRKVSEEMMQKKAEKPK